MNTKTTITKLSAIIALTASLTVGLATAPAEAAQTGTNSTSYTKSELEDDGYDCETVSLGFIECTKGSKTYWCSGGTCTEMKTTSGTRRPELVGGSTQVITSAYTPISITNPRPTLSKILGAFTIAR